MKSELQTMQVLKAVAKGSVSLDGSEGSVNGGIVLKICLPIYYP